MDDYGRVAAYRKDTGEKQLVPPHWLDHPVLGVPFERTPRQRAEDRKKPPTAPAAGDKKE